MPGQEPTRLLLVEPDTAQAAAVEQAFAAAGGHFAVARVATVADFKAQLSGGEIPALVFAPPRLGPTPATDLLRISADPARWPLVLLADAATPPGDLTACLDAGAFDYVLTHPATLPDLPHRTGRLLQEWELARRQRDADAAVREKEAFNFALFQHNPAAMVVVDHGGRVLKSNLARRALDEHLPTLGAPLYDPARGEPEKALADALRDCLARQTVQQVADLAWGARWFNLVMAPLPRGAVVLLEDITRRKRAEAEAEERQRQLIQADKMVALGNLVAGVAHELSNPNNAMLLSATALKRLVDDLIAVLDQFHKQEGDFDVGPRAYTDVRSELPELVSVVGRTAQRIKSLVDDLKAFARRTPETLNETVQVNAVLDAAVNLMQPLIRKSTHRFSVEKAPDLPTVAGNAQRLEQVAINLLGNACQALTGPDRAVAAATRWDAAAGQVLIEIRDEGRGIPAALLDKITEPFFTTRHDDGGTGLGLSISKSIVEQHKGQLCFTSVPGQGTVATVRLPARAGAPPPAAERGGTPAA